ncbi:MULTISPECIES: hypothetical protein [Enterobacterales]|uniref:hypothetical protein n=1 Tax=Enterobacterales TaxID=91347 RepID=UPI0005ED4190|nr:MULTISPECIES: hypothetical protein [Enterobacteriaceae]EDF6232700.1 hypothetical protein [Salmonella enterica subsp. enterica serovar Senftenberg]HBQ9086501.1 hypothetical protein [Klebsiella quasipneumoniae]HDU3837891.1 hypothetical protein [Klebsiella pneumoniae subsp. pneumoniae]HED2944285.1 hypothetical protein [Enterobacter hormaechei subsp. xiangfangensis]AUV95750.1 hypothetical protein C2U44_32800 [Klebsiella oxytoca]
MEYTEREREFYIGAMWATSTMWRMHTDSVAVKDMLNELPDAHDIARYCAEYDIQPLRLNVMDSLPLGCDAAYTSISYGPINSRGEIICDHSEIPEGKEDEYDSYCVYAVEPDGTRLVLVVDKYSEEEAKGQADLLTEQLLAILAETNEKESAE